MTAWNPFENIEQETLDRIEIAGLELRRGDRVRIRPRKIADILDMALDGRIAEIESIDVDYENNVHLALIVDDDPGRDLGRMRQPGHRFFFAPNEVELVREPQ